MTRDSWIKRYLSPTTNYQGLEDILLFVWLIQIASHFLAIGMGENSEGNWNAQAPNYSHERETCTYNLI